MLNPTLLAASVALAAVCALLATVSAWRCSKTLTQMRAAVSQIISLRGKIEVHDSELEAVTDSIRLLRGKFYAERRKSQQITSNSDSAEEAIGAGTVDAVSLKDHLRRKAGLRAGQPARHT